MSARFDKALETHQKQRGLGGQQEKWFTVPQWSETQHIPPDTPSSICAEEFERNGQTRRVAMDLDCMKKLH